MEDYLYLPVMEATEVGQARRTVSEFSRRLGFDEIEAGKVAIVVSELSSNLVKHAARGELLVRIVADGPRPGLELLALDSGPGFDDAAASMKDGFSTTGTMGTGLGAIRRLSGFFDIYSLPERGSVVMSEMWQNRSRAAQRRFDIGAVAVPKQGEPVSGDSWSAQQEKDCLRLVLADGLGHGEIAAEASLEAVRVFMQNPRQSPGEALEQIHGALKKTRGAAVAVANIDLEREIVTFAGLGNIAGAIITSTGRRSLVSHNGTAGYEARKIQEFTYPWAGDALLILHSDGLGSRWELERYPGLAARRASIIAGRLYFDFTRHSDDVTVLAVKENRP